MTRRFRTLAALLALLAFALSGAESLWASMCSAEMEVQAMAGSEAGCPPGMAPADSHGGSDGREIPGADCPLVGLGASGCLAPVGLPASAAASLASPPGGTRPVQSADHVRLLLLSGGLFHPPRA